MKTSFVSTSAISTALRYQMMRLQSDLVKNQVEQNSGKHADVGLALGARTGQSVSFHRDISRLETIADANSVATARLNATQEGLGQVTNAAQSFFATLTAATSGDASSAVTSGDARGAYQSLRDVMNMSLNGEHIFAGTNTDVQPLSDFTDPASTARIAFEDAFSAHFGFASGDAQAANITASQMTSFLDGPVTDLFLGAGWNTEVSSASDQTITSRITTTETAQTSVSANTDGVRKLAMASAIVIGLFDTAIGGEARNVVVKRAYDLTASSIAAITDVRAEAGVTQQRLVKANERLDMQVGVFKTGLTELEGVDPYEAASKVANLLTQIETSYALTARIQQLSLLKFL